MPVGSRPGSARSPPRFEGEASVVADRASHSGRVEGKGVDKRGGSRSRLLLDYRLTEVERQTRVDLSADVTLSGPIAQFGPDRPPRRDLEYPDTRIRGLP